MPARSTFYYRPVPCTNPDFRRSVTAQRSKTLLGEGLLDQKRLMKPIIDAGYDGWMVIESAKEGVPQDEYVAHATRYIREELLG